VAVTGEEAASLEFVQRAGDRLSRRSDHLSEQIVRERKLYADTVWTDSPELPPKLQELLANAIDMADAAEVARCILPKPQRVSKTSEERGGRTRYREQVLDPGEWERSDPAFGERLEVLTLTGYKHNGTRAGFRDHNSARRRRRGVDDKESLLDEQNLRSQEIADKRSSALA
jgi:hypothetical protein